MTTLLVRGAIDQMHRSLLGEGPGRPVLSVLTGERAIIARKLTKGVLLFRRARLDLHALEALRENRQIRYGDLEAITAMHVEEDIEPAPELRDAVTAALLAMEHSSIPTASKATGALITVTAFGSAPGESIARTFHEASDPALSAAISPLLAALKWS